jgi:hypothetical protein
LSQARKYHLNLIVANQFTTQLSEEIRDAVFGNVGTVISFRVGTTDAEFLAKQFAPTFDIDDLQFIPNANTVMRMMIGGVPMQPFSMATLPPLGNPNPQLTAALKQLSAAKYGRPKAQVEENIFKRLETKAPQRPALGSGPMVPGGFNSNLPPSLRSPAASQFPQSYGAGPSPFGPVPSGLPPSSPAPTSTGSGFLDEWLSKRKSAGAAPPPGGAKQPAPAPFQPPPVASPVPPQPILTPVDSTPKAEAAKEPNPSPKDQNDAAFKPVNTTNPEEPGKSEAQTGKPGEFKINRGSTQSEEAQTVHIDRDGSISY